MTDCVSFLPKSTKKYENNRLFRRFFATPLDGVIFDDKVAFLCSFFVLRRFLMGFCVIRFDNDDRTMFAISGVISICSVIGIFRISVFDDIYKLFDRYGLFVCFMAVL